jgi:hypothetical protein
MKSVWKCLFILSLTSLLVTSGPVYGANVFETFNDTTISSYGTWDYHGFHGENSLIRPESTCVGNNVRLRNADSPLPLLEYRGSDGNGKDGGVGVISFWYRNWDGSPAAQADVKVNVNGVGWTTIGSHINTTSLTCLQWSYSLNDPSDNILVRVEHTTGVSSERLHIDDFSITDYSAGDTTRPTILSATPVSTTQVDVLFSENVEQTTAETVANYSIDGGIGSPTLATRDGTDNALVHLTVSTLTPYVIYTLTVNNVQDLAGNAILPNSTAQFSLRLQLGDVIVTEFMANPSSVADDKGEWFEIYNTTANAINLNGWIIKDNAGADTIEGDYYVGAGDYFVFCVNETLATNGGVPTDYRYVYGTSGWGLALANTSDQIVLLDNLNRAQDSVVYNAGWGVTPGASHQLKTAAYDENANDISTNWCIADIPWPGSAYDKGTPGAPTDCAQCIWINIGESVCLPYFLGAGEAYGIHLCWCCPFGTETWMTAMFSWAPGCEHGIPGCDTLCIPYYGPVHGLDGASQRVVANPYECTAEPGVGYWTTKVWIEGEGCICVTFDDQLPVELTTFEAIAGDREVTLNWTTASEDNNAKFEIARSTAEHGDFVKITEMEGAGTKSSETNYTYIDENVINGVTYFYQLTAVDINGARNVQGLIASATPAQIVGSVTDYALHSCYPNPFNAITDIRYDILNTGHVRLEIFDVLGRAVALLVDKEQSSGRYSIHFNASQLPTGVYLYRLQVNEFTATKKMMMLK